MTTREMFNRIKDSVPVGYSILTSETIVDFENDLFWNPKKLAFEKYNEDDPEDVVDNPDTAIAGEFWCVVRKGTTPAI